MSPPRSLAWEHRGYRIIWLAQLGSNAGTNAQKIALAWLALTTSGSLASGAVTVGLVSGIRFLPMLALSAWASSHLDAHHSLGRLLARVEFLGAALTGLGAALLLTGHAQLPVLLALSLCSGIPLVVEPAALTLLVLGSVPTSLRANALASMTLLYDIGKIAVPAAAGVAIALGATPALLVANALSGALLGAVAWRAGGASPESPASERLVEDTTRVPGGADSQVRTESTTPSPESGHPGPQTRRRLVVMTLLALPALELATFLPLLSVLGASASVGRYASIGLAAGVGSIIGGGACARWVRRGGMGMALANLAAYAAALLLVAACTHHPLPLALSIAVAAALLSSTLTVSSVTFQLTATPAERGRVAGTWARTITGGTLASAPVGGILAALLGAPRGLAVAALAALLGVGVLLAPAALCGVRARLRGGHPEDGVLAHGVLPAQVHRDLSRELEPWHEAALESSRGAGPGA